MQRTQISLTDGNRRLLDDESKRSGKSLSSLIRHAVDQTYGRPSGDLAARIRAAAGAWADRELDGEEYVESLRSGSRMDAVRER